MNTRQAGADDQRVRLRAVQDSDLPIFFAHQRDPVAIQMVGFPGREWDAFLAHWTKIRADPANITRTILAAGQVAGHIGSWEQDGEREVGYWLGREYWGRGIATQALAAFLRHVPARPLYARVAQHNGGSRRVLEKCGFTVCGEDQWEAIPGSAPIPEWILILQAAGPAAAQPARHLAWDACYNVRDIGDYLTESGGRTRPQALIRADNLHRLTPTGQAALRAYGVQTIIDLRLDDELERDPNPFAAQQDRPDSPRYRHLPLHDLETNAALDAAQAVQGEYILIVERNKALVAAVIQAVAAGLAAGGVVVHCHGGKDRTGIVVALLLALVGVPPATIIEDYVLSQDRLAAPNAAWLEEQRRIQGRPIEPPSWMFTPPEKMAALLAYLDQEYGGVVGYLTAAGVAETDLVQIRAQLLVPPAELNHEQGAAQSDKG